MAIKQRLPWGSKFIATCLSQARRRVLLPALISTRCFLHVLCDTREGEWVELACSPIVSQSSECWENLSVGSCVISPYMCTGKVRAAHGSSLSLSLFLSLSLCFPFILLPRSRSRMKQGTGLESASYQKNLDKRNCFLSTTAAALVFYFFSTQQLCLIIRCLARFFFFFFFGGFEVSVLQ